VSVNILIAWEKGSGAGHLSRMLAISKQLTERGNKVTLAIPKQFIESKWIKDCGVDIVVCPEVLQERTAFKGVYSFADMLVNFGFTNHKSLQIAVNNWLALFKKLSIDKVIIDYAPTAMLACYLTDVKTFQISDGFDAPDVDFQAFIGKSITDSDKAITVTHISDTIRKIAFNLDVTKSCSIGDYLNWSDKYYDTIPEMMIYEKFIKGPFIGPMVYLPNRVNLGWKYNAKPSVFMYARRNNPMNHDVLIYLKRNNIKTVCVYPEVSATEKAIYQDSCVQITESPVNLQETLEAVTHVISYGATGTMSSALIAGKPHLVIPVDTQKRMVCSKSLITNAVVVVDHFSADIQKLMKDFFDNQDIIKAAQVYAKKYSFEDFKIKQEGFINDIINN
jgi:hypothetical protein